MQEVERTTILDDLWLRVRDGDMRAFSLYRRHYSFKRERSAKKQVARGPNWNRIGAGCERLLFLTPLCDALFVWIHPAVPRLDKQEGTCCLVFRNEGAIRSSD